jgi:predicted Zn-dependent protease with MMP-like domain
MIGPSPQRQQGNLAGAAGFPIIVMADLVVDNPHVSWQHVLMKRMSLKKFGSIVAEVMETLPQRWQTYLHNVVVDVEDEPDLRTLRLAGFTEEEIAEGDSLYGLFVPLDVGSPWGGEAVDVHDLPHRILIFKRPLEEDFPDRTRLMIEIRKTVIHELAHHFGYTDRDLEEFDDNPNPFKDEPAPGADFLEES